MLVVFMSWPMLITWMLIKENVSQGRPYKWAAAPAIKVVLQPQWAFLGNFVTDFPPNAVVMLC